MTTEGPIDSRPTCEINGIRFWPVDGVEYANDYPLLTAQMVDGEIPAFETIRRLCTTDLWFIVYFVLGIPISNHPFWVKACRDVGEGPGSHTLDLWARNHGKSSIITTADTIRRLLANSDETIAIFSYARPPALKFLRQIKFVLEQSVFLKDYFPDILFRNPEKEAWKWAEETGLYLRRNTTSKEPSLSAFGLIEGMPTGAHFSGRIYDDIVTQDSVLTPDMMQRVKDAFDMSQNLGTADGWHRVIGTPYHHQDALQYIREKRNANGELLYHVRLKPATVDGTPNGESVFMPESALAELRANRQMFFSQQLLDPTPQGTQALDSALLVETAPADLPDKLWKFMVIDPAGVRKDREGDSWAILVVGVEPKRDDTGASKIYVLDAVIQPMPLSEALKTIVLMYLRNGRIVQVGVEKVGASTMEVHVAQALHARGKVVSVEAGTLKLLYTGGKQKQFRIEQALSWPLQNGNIHISKAVPIPFRERIKTEMQKFPFWHDDALDALAYVYEMIKEYRFGTGVRFEGDVDSFVWERKRELKRDVKHGWMVI